MKKGTTFYLTFNLFIDLILLAFFALPGMSNAQERASETPDISVLNATLCKPTDEACFAALPCPQGMTEEECTTYKEGLVKAARDPGEAQAGEDTVMLVGVQGVFSARESRIPSQYTDDEIEYWWEFGDFSDLVEGKEITHAYKESGNYRVTLTIKTGEGTLQDTQEVSVMERAIFLIMSEDLDPFTRMNVATEARRNGFLVYELTLRDQEHEFIVENNLVAALFERNEEIKRASFILGWTKNSVEIQALARFGTQREEDNGFLRQKDIVIVSNNMTLTSRRAQPLFDILQPKSLLIVSPELVETALEGGAKNQLVSAVQRQGKDFALLGIHSRRSFEKVTFYNFFSYFINVLINKGVSIMTILLILMLPVVATLVAFTRQVIGIKTLGIYIPTILTLTFVAIGLQVGILLLVVIVALGTFMRLILKRMRLLYVPRMALLITAVSFGMLLLFYLEGIVTRFSLLSVSVFPLLILIMLVEELVKVQIEQGTENALILTGETLILSIAAYFIMNWQTVRNLLLSYPEIILITVIINVALGKWAGLRLFEYYRFRDVLRTLHSLDKQGKTKT